MSTYKKYETETLMALATETYRLEPSASQDAAMKFELPHFNLMAVCDGIGSFAYAGEAARFCIEALQKKEVPKLASKNSTLNLWELFRGLQDGLRRYALARQGLKITELETLEQMYGTTLIFGGESQSELGFTYVGNGCAFRLPGHFWEIPEHIALPWFWTNLLTPHSRWVNGKEALARYLSPCSSPAMVKPTSLRMTKDDHFGDILIFATDGLYTSDQSAMGKLQDTFWVQTEMRVLLLHRVLSDLFCSPEPLTQTRLEESLQLYLQILKRDGLIEDDITLGVIVTGTALEYRDRTHGL